MYCLGKFLNPDTTDVTQIDYIKSVDVSTFYLHCLLGAIINEEQLVAPFQKTVVACLVWNWELGWCVVDGVRSEVE